MKSRFITTIFILIFTTANLFAQPLPPATPSGNPVPVGELAALLLVLGGGILLVKRKKN
jgi:LPXTG-motif cell wall-anchored protein